MKIDYQEVSRTFIIDAKIYENQTVRELPNKRFSNRFKAWIAPCIKSNARAIKEWLVSNNIQISLAASIAMEQVLKVDKIKRVKFPRDYPFKMEPREHQLRGLDLTYGLKRAAFFVEMGLGKTMMSIVKMTAHWNTKDIEGIVVVCPCSIRTTWVNEYIKHGSSNSLIFVLDSLNTKKDLEEYDKFNERSKFPLKVLIVGIESLSQRKKERNKIKRASKIYDAVEKFMVKHKTAIILDEAHTIKNPDSLRTKNIFDLSQASSFRLAMTGTPISQGLLDIYSIFEFLDPDILGIGDFWSFKNRYAVMGGFENKEIVGFKNVDELLEIIQPFIFQCTKKEALDLPEKIYIRKNIEMTLQQKTMYLQMKRERKVEIIKAQKEGKSDMVIAKNVLSMYGSLQQITSGFIRRGTGDFIQGKELRCDEEIISSKTNPKIQELKNIIADIPDNEQVIIWAKYRYEIELIEKELKGYRTKNFENNDPVVYKPGSLEFKQKCLDKINNKKSRYFISTQTSGGVGLTLNTVAYVVYFSNSFSFLTRAQSEDRNHRIGQERTVTYIDLVCENTVDERVLDVLSEKKNMADFVMQTIKSKSDIMEEVREERLINVG